jgi:hypothetical protein
MLINFSNHKSSKWSCDQLNAAKEYGEIVDIAFPEVDPKGSEEYIETISEKYLNEIKETAKGQKAFVHIMGEMTLTYSLIKKLQKEHFICIASTTKRITVEKENGTFTTQFIFEKFRIYK